MGRYLVSQEIILTIDAEDEFAALEAIPKVLHKALRTGQYMIGSGCYIVRELPAERRNSA